MADVQTAQPQPTGGVGAKPPEKKKGHAGPVPLEMGKLIGARWKIVEKLGEGGCGAVYKVQDIKSKPEQYAALKAESNFTTGGSVLKLEVAVLRKLEKKKFVAKLLASGKKESYCYMVMTLFGPSLHKLLKQCKKEFSTSTLARLGIMMLYGIKQIHEIGYVHRDLKPANMAVGADPSDCKIVHLLDFGLAREFITRATGQIEIRRSRENALFRGTTKYCSPSSHKKMDQGRPDDLWAMCYILAEMKGPLPWEGQKDKHEIGWIKRTISDRVLFKRCPSQMIEISQHLRNLNYYARPDYARIFLVFREIMTENNVSFADPMDWEMPRNSNNNNNVSRKQPSRVRTIQEDVSVAKTSMEPTQKENDNASSNNADPFTLAEFESNEIGF